MDQGSSSTIEEPVRSESAITYALGNVFGSIVFGGSFYLMVSPRCTFLPVLR